MIHNEKKAKIIMEKMRKPNLNFESGWTVIGFYWNSKLFEFDNWNISGRDWGRKLGNEKGLILLPDNKVSS